MIDDLVSKLDKLGVQIITSDDVRPDYSNAMLVILAKHHLMFADDAWKIDHSDYSNALIITENELIKVLESDLEGIVPAPVQVAKWKKERKIVYHNFFLMDSTLILETASGASELVPERKKYIDDYADSLWEVFESHIVRIIKSKIRH